MPAAGALGHSARFSGGISTYPAFGSMDNAVLGAFDFGSGMPLPPSRVEIKQEFTPQRAPVFINVARGPSESPFRSFSRNADIPLLDYIRGRNLSPHFLTEIDHFLAAHPEIAEYIPSFANSINYGPMLDAYMFFMRGYTKPARYANGFLPDLYNFRVPEILPQIANIVDPELEDFFNGHDYRYDILRVIDREVETIARKMYYGQHVTFAQRKLVVYALFGNVADAYKYYEYNYQQEWLKHRYLPEHVILDDLPKPEIEEHQVLNARVISQPGQDCRDGERFHKDTRARMARANDEGVDPIEVLIEDFTAALCRRGLRRAEIEQMRQQARRNIEHMRDTGDDRDIVNVIMDRVDMTGPSNFGRRIRKKDGARLARIEKLKRTLHRLAMHEDVMLRDEPEWVFENVMKMRQRVERELVEQVTSMAQAGGMMSGNEAAGWRQRFSKKEQQAREAAGRRVDVFRELSRFL